MCKWIAKGWQELESDYLKQSFKYCGITTSILSEYHSPLLNLLTQAVIPPNTTIECRNEEDEHQDIFLTEEAEQTDTETIDAHSSEDDSPEQNLLQSESDSSSESDHIPSQEILAQSSNIVPEKDAQIATITNSGITEPTASVRLGKSNITIQKILIKPKATSISKAKAKTNQIGAENIENLILPQLPGTNLSI